MYKDYFRNSPAIVELAEKATRAQFILSDLFSAWRSICAEIQAKYRQLERKSDPICNLSQAAEAHPPEIPTIHQRLISFISGGPDIKKESLRAEAKLHFASERITKGAFNAAFSEVKGYGRGRPRQRAR